MSKKAKTVKDKLNKKLLLELDLLLTHLTGVDISVL